MTRFTCPGCGDVVEAIGTEVMHPCPKRRNRLTLYVPRRFPETPTQPETPTRKDTEDGVD